MYWAMYVYVSAEADVTPRRLAVAPCRLFGARQPIARICHAARLALQQWSSAHGPEGGGAGASAHAQPFKIVRRSHGAPDARNSCCPVLFVAGRGASLWSAMPLPKLAFKDAALPDGALPGGNCRSAFPSRTIESLNPRVRRCGLA